MKKTKTLLMVMLAISLVLTACDEEVGFNLSVDEEVEYEEAVGGEIALPLRIVKSLNPIISSSEDLYQFNKLIYEGLFELGEGLEPVEALAESYSIPAGSNSIEVNLRQGVKWHDGSPLRSQDVVFTIETIKSALASDKYRESLSPLYKEGGVYDISKIKKVELVSELSVRIEFEDRSADILEYLTMPILPSHASNSLEEAMKSEDYKPIGTGPYVVDKIDMFKQVDLVRNEDYWNGASNIEHITGRVLKSRGAGKAAFDSGRINAIYDRGDDWEEYTENERIEISEFSSNRQLFLSPNHRQERFSGEDGAKLRKAISLGIDREYILDEIYLGYGYLSDTIIDPNSWLSSLGEADFEAEYDVEEAKSILEELGYSENSSGVLEDEDGEKLQITIASLPRDARRYRAVEHIASNIEELGIEVERDYTDTLLSDLDLEEVESRVSDFKSKLSGESYDIAVIEYDQSYLPDISQLLESSYIDESNYSGYSSEELDSLFDRLSGVRTKEEKKSIYGEIENHLKEQLPLIPIVHSEGALISYRRIHGEINPNYFSVYRKIGGWFIPSEFQLNSEENEK